MASSQDIGIDLGTASVVIYGKGKGVVLNANQWAGNGFWDKAGIVYTAPEAQNVILKSGKIGTIAPAADIDAENCSVNETRVAIYKNGKKIWPKDAEFVAIKKGESVDFPEIELSLKKGDEILIEAYGAKPGGSISDANGNDWRNAVRMDPVIAVKADAEENPDTGVTVIPVVAAMLLASSATGLVVINRKRR